MIHSNYFFNSAMSPSTFKQKKSAMVIFLSPNITAAHTLFYNFLLSDCLSVLYACYAISSGRPSWVDIRKQNSRRCLVVAYKHTRSVECLALVSSLRDNLFHRHHHHTHLKCWSYSVAVSSEFSQHRPPARHYDESRSPRRCRVQQYRDLLVP